jgi:hypothetical protein
MSFQTVEQLQTSVAELTAENKRLRELVEEAYEEGYKDCADKADYTWVTSIALRNLQPKRGNQ